MTVALHWVTAALVAALWTIGQTVDVFPNGPLRIDYRSVHILLGVILAPGTSRVASGDASISPRSTTGFYW